MNKLSIGIPTYNRKDQLEHQLKCIINQDLSNLEEIIVVDNNSDYDIEGMIEKLNCPKIILKRNEFNIKMATNMEMPFLHCKTEWLWLLSDDDEVLPDSINTILNEINACDTNTGMIKFAIERPTSTQKAKVVSSLEEFIDYYHEEKVIRRGDLVFISTNVYNMQKLKSHLGTAFEYSYTYIGFLIPTFFALNQQSSTVKFSSKAIVNYIPPREGWYSFGTVGKGLSTLSHIPLNISKRYKKKFLNITMSISHSTLIRGFLNNDKIDQIDDFKKIYNNIYRYYLSIKGKIVTNIFFVAMDFKLTRIIAFATFKYIKRKK